ncbi:MAG: GAF domain-containing protein [bacterium]
MVDVIKRLSLLNEAARAMTSLMDPDALLDRILDLTTEVFGFDACAILLLEPDSGELIIRRARGYDAAVVEAFRGHPGEGVTGRAFAERKPVLVHDVASDQSYIPGVSGAISEIAVPLSLNGEVIGVLDAESQQRLTFSDEDRELICAFASHAATAVNNARLHGELAARSADLDRKLQQQRLLARASEVMLSTLSPEQVLAEILSLAGEALPFETCAVLLLDDDRTKLVLRAAQGYRDEVRGLEIPLGKGVTGEVVQSGAPVLIPDVKQDPRYIEGVTGGRCEMTVPLCVRGETIGVLDAEAREPNAFDDEDLALFSIFASHAAVALRNAALHDRLERNRASLQRQMHRQELVRRAGDTVRSALKQDLLLRRILELAREALDFQTCAVLLLDEDRTALSVHASVGYGRDVNGLVIPAGQGISGEVLETSKAVLVADVTQDPRYIDGMTDGRCEMVAPLLVDGELIGVLDAESTAVGAFDDEDVALFKIFASDVAVAIRNCRQFDDLERANAVLQENVLEIERMNADLSAFADEISRTNQDLEKRVAELRTLYEASQTITSSLDLQQTLDTIVDMTKVIINASSSAIRLLDEESEELRTKTGSPAAKAAAKQQPRLTSGAQLQTPLKIGDRTIGFFELGKDVGEFNDEEKRMLRTLAGQAAIAIENSRLFDRTQRTYYETIRALAEALEARDAYTRGHSDRVTRYALAIAEALDLTREEIRIIEHAGLLHDIGKIGISDTILNKTTRLSEEDRKAIEHHPIFGDTILGPIKFLNMVQTVVKHHHERYDGGGYPDGLKGEDIPLSARIVGVADAFDAMNSHRTYRPALARQDALDELIKNRGLQFDPRVVDVFIDLLESRFPVRQESLSLPPVTEEADP